MKLLSMFRSGLLRSGAFAGLVLALAASPSLAGPFDCSVVYDEFDSFMNKGYLVSPDKYGPVLAGKITREYFDQNQKGRLLLRPGREGMGVAVVRTNNNGYGKLLFSWGGRGDAQGTPLLVLRDITLYTDVENGSGLKLTREVRVTSSQSVDLDSGRASSGADADLTYRNIDGKTLLIEPVNGASLTFPMETLCAR